MKPILIIYIDIFLVTEPKSDDPFSVSPFAIEDLCKLFR